MLFYVIILWLLVLMQQIHLKSHLLLHLLRILQQARKQLKINPIGTNKK